MEFSADYLRRRSCYAREQKEFDQVFADFMDTFKTNALNAADNGQTSCEVDLNKTWVTEINAKLASMGFTIIWNDSLCIVCW
jgi:hypothetical protein